MKLLLTSMGLTNDSIASALFEMTGKRPEETTLVFIPTASNAEAGDKSWLIADLINLKKLNFKAIEITDISAVDETIWKPSLERADVLFFEGGNTYHLMRWLNKSGLAKALPELLKDKVYVGLSAGSMVTNPDLSLKLSQELFEEDMLETEELKGLNFVDFYFLPHLNSEWFKKVRKENIEKVGQEISRKIYALDDNSALKIIGNKIEVISEGEWFVINEKQ
ncbi:MAG: Type 1 glutamine amidotransferase-like domain-containing protein [Candidatus Aenigmarchaeota archaeon]|nr:Type 1 glutamine amidotransferase-like domain-containing protein [Candidatus Aenigmarchaeota archaeon]